MAIRSDSNYWVFKVAMLNKKVYIYLLFILMLSSKLFSYEISDSWARVHLLETMGLRYILDIPVKHPNLKVAVLDGGIDYNNQYLKNQVINVYDYLNDDNDPIDEDGHGTGIAGIIAAEHNLQKNHMGLNPSVKILNIQTSRAFLYSYDAAIMFNAVKDAVDRGARVINCSFSRTNTITGKFQEAFEYARDSGVIIVASGKNEEGYVPYPAAYNYTIGVAGLNEEYTEKGAGSSGNYIDFAMPAIKINSTSLQSSYDGYAPYNGTSFATPIVTAIVSRLLSYDPTMTREQVLTKLSAHSTQLPDGGAETGYGKIDAKSLALSYVDIEERKIKAEARGHQYILEIKIVRDKQTKEITRKVLEYIWIDNKKHPIHKEFEF